MKPMKANCQIRRITSVLLYTATLLFVAGCSSSKKKILDEYCEPPLVTDIVHLDILHAKIIHHPAQGTSELAFNLKFTNTSNRKILFRCDGKTIRLIKFGELLVNEKTYTYTPAHEIRLGANKSTKFHVRFPVTEKKLKKITYKYHAVYWEWGGVSRGDNLSQYIKCSYTIE